MQQMQELGGQGEVMTLALANGFPPAVYLPMIRPLTEQHRVVSLLPRAMWGDAPLPRERRSWKHTVAADYAQTIRDYDLSDIIGMGHSFGAVGTLLAATAMPDRFRGLVLLDPTIMPRPINWGFRLSQLLGRQTPLSRRAEKRQDRFASHEEAYDYFKGKRLFHDWPDETLRLYVESLVVAPDGALRLAWPREWEAYYFDTLYTGIWGDMKKLAKTGLPVLVIRGGQSNTFFPPAARRMQRLLPNMTYREINGHGHLFPQSAPEQTAGIVMDWLAGI